MGVVKKRHVAPGLKRNQRASGGFGTVHLLIVLIVGGWLAAYAGLKARDAAYAHLDYDPGGDSTSVQAPTATNPAEINFN